MDPQHAVKVNARKHRDPQRLKMVLASIVSSLSHKANNNQMCVCPDPEYDSCMERIWDYKQIAISTFSAKDWLRKCRSKYLKSSVKTNIQKR